MANEVFLHGLYEREFQKIQQAINNIINGKLNSYGELTLTNSATITTRIDPRCGVGSLIFLTATSLASANETALYIEVGNKQFSIKNHSSSTTERKFKYLIIN